MRQEVLPVGKLPAKMLKDLLARLPARDPRVLLGPGIGMDCAVVEASDRLLVLKSDPITFATDAIGWYAVQVNANDLATTGATPRWMLVTLLLPADGASHLAEQIICQLEEACRPLNLTIIGGHTEITHGLERPIVVGSMIGEVERERLVTPRGALPGDRLLLTKGIPIEATALLAREFADRLTDPTNGMSQADLQMAQDFLYKPGISVVREAQAAVQAGGVHAMHDPTEGGLYAALWELAEACNHPLRVDPSAVPVYPLSSRICQILGLDPLGALASGALLLAVAADSAQAIIRAIEQEGIECSEIGLVSDEKGLPLVWAGAGAPTARLPRPTQDEIAKLF
jgi:hydrogenase maturation factor